MPRLFSRRRAWSRPGPKAWPMAWPKKTAPGLGRALIGRPQIAAGWVLAELVLRLFPSDSRDVATGNADIRQLAIAEVRKLVHGNAIALPGLEEVDDSQQHVLVPL